MRTVKAARAPHPRSRSRVHTRAAMDLNTARETFPRLDACQYFFFFFHSNFSSIFGDDLSKDRRFPDQRNGGNRSTEIPLQIQKMDRKIKRYLDQ